MHTPFSSIRRRAQKLAAPMVSLAGLALFAAPAPAQAQSGDSCKNDWQCRSASGWEEVSWCHQGSCVDMDRRSPECIQPARFCFADFMCSDGNANTVTWCEFTEWSWFGQCHAAPRDGGGTCDPDAGEACLIDKDCEDDDPRTNNWCYRGTCVEADRNDASCRDEGNHCRRDWQCNDGDPDTKDWCYLGSCYNAPNDTGVCEGGSQCDPQDCPDDNNECTRAACDDDEQCLQENIVGTCDGGNGTCDNGTCVPNPPNCVPTTCPDDGNECTMAACDGNECMQQKLVGDPCDNGNGTCQDGSCVANPPTCDPATCPSDGNECTQAACLDDVCAQENLPDGQSCSDGNGTCQDGSCVANPPTCDPATCPSDGNECTQTACVDNACAQQNVAEGQSCSDGNGTCQAGNCVANPPTCDPATCPDDGNACTTSNCDPVNGCSTSNVADGTSCGNAGETCQAGICEGSSVQPPDCEPITVVLKHTRRGAVNSPEGSFSQWKVIANSYQIRSQTSVLDPTQDFPLTSNYTCFDLSALPTGTVVQAELEMSHSENSYASEDPSENVVFREMTEVECGANLDSPPLAAPPNHQQIFDDLNEGTILAEFTATLSDNGPNPETPRAERFPVNPAGLASLQAKLGSASAWGIGGSLSTADGGSPGKIERIFRGTDESGGTIWPSAILSITIKPDSCGANQVVLSPRDIGYYLKAVVADSGAVVQSFHYESASRGEHKALFVGNQNALVGVRGNIERRAYSVWDVGAINNAVSGKLRVWGWQRSQANNYSGAYNSQDESEVVGLFPVNTPGTQIINAPFNDVSNHTIDVPIFDDLGDLQPGESSYGERLYTAADRTVNLVPAFRADPDTVCDPLDSNPQAPCGKWLEFELTQAAIQDINASNGLWTIGKAMTTIGGENDKKEWVNNGILADMDVTNSNYPSFVSPEPQLILRTN